MAELVRWRLDEDITSTEERDCDERRLDGRDAVWEGAVGRKEGTVDHCTCPRRQSSSTMKHEASTRLYSKARQTDLAQHGT